MIQGEISLYRRHTGSAVSEINDKIVESINKLEAHFQILDIDRVHMKEKEVSNRVVAELLGRMYIEEEIINSTQLNIIKNEILEPSYKEFSGNTVWDFYNHCTHSLKKSHTLNMMQDHINIHEFFDENVLIS